MPSLRWVSDPSYAASLGFGWAALALAGVAAAAALLVEHHPVAASSLIACSGLVGALAINLFDINTLYLLAVPFWLMAAVLGLAEATRTVGRDPIKAGSADVSGLL